MGDDVVRAKSIDMLDAFLSSQSGLDKPHLVAHCEVTARLFICSLVSIARPKSITPGDFMSSPFLASGDGERGIGLPIFKSVVILGAGGFWCGRHHRTSRHCCSGDPKRMERIADAYVE